VALDVTLAPLDAQQFTTCAHLMQPGQGRMQAKTEKSHTLTELEQKK